jgi:peptide/nickel transport system substrate-binding protein
LRDAWLDAPDQPARQRVANDIQRTVWDEVPYIPVGQWTLPIAHRANLTGLVRGPYPVFWNVAKG